MKTNPIVMCGAVLIAAQIQAAAQTEPNAGAWKTWVLSSGKELRLPPPPGTERTANELAWLKGYMSENKAAAEL